MSDCVLIRKKKPEPVKADSDTVLRAQSFQTYGKLSQAKKEDTPQITISWADLQENLKCPTEVKVYITC